VNRRTTPSHSVRSSGTAFQCSDTARSASRWVRHVAAAACSERDMAVAGSTSSSRSIKGRAISYTSSMIFARSPTTTSYLELK
jgi:hypothetical protein